MKKLVLALGMMAYSVTTFAANSEKEQWVRHANDCKISANSPTNSFPIYHTIDKAIFMNPINSPEFNDGDKLPVESKPEEAMILLRSELLGGGVILNLKAKNRFSSYMMEDDGEMDEQMLQTEIYSGKVKVTRGSGEKQVFNVSGSHRIFILDGDHWYDFDFKLKLKDPKSGEEYNYYFECENFDDLKDDVKD
jgi:hypothetical protein